MRDINGVLINVGAKVMFVMNRNGIKEGKSGYVISIPYTSDRVLVDFFDYTDKDSECAIWEMNPKNLIIEQF